MMYLLFRQLYIRKQANFPESMCFDMEIEDYEAGLEVS